MDNDSSVIVLCGPTHLPGMGGVRVYRLEIDGLPHLAQYVDYELNGYRVVGLFATDHKGEDLRTVPHDATTAPLFQRIAQALKDKLDGNDDSGTGSEEP